MRNTKRKALLATVLGLAAVTAAIPMVVSGTASAQTNSRLCGQYFKSKTTGEVVTKLLEVRKSDKAVCSGDRFDAINPSSFPGRKSLRDQNLGTEDFWTTDSFKFVVCEDLKTRPVEFGGLGNLEIDFNGDNFPTPHDQFDICQNMNRSDTTFDIEAYWLYEDADAGNANGDKVQFRRG